MKEYIKEIEQLASKCSCSQSDGYAQIMRICEAMKEERTNNCEDCLNTEYIQNKLSESRESGYKKAVEDIQFSYEQGKVDVIKEIINNIPCKKNCNVCLRNGITSCYEPEEKYVAKELFEKIIKMM